MPGASGPSAGPGLRTVDVTEEVLFCKEPASTATVSPARLASSGLTMGGIPETPLGNSIGEECRSGERIDSMLQIKMQFLNSSRNTCLIKNRYTSFVIR